MLHGSAQLGVVTETAALQVAGFAASRISIVCAAPSPGRFMVAEVAPVGLYKIGLPLCKPSIHTVKLLLPLMALTESK